MLPDLVDTLPFPCSLVFDDVEDEVLYAEAGAERLPDAPASWLAYMLRVLPEHVVA